MTITFPENTRDTINAIRGAIGRAVSIYTIGTASGCSACSLDPINNTSTDPFCTTCNGNYWTLAYNATTISGHVRWYPFEEKKFTSAGIVHEGDCVVTIEHDADIMQIVASGEYVIVDDQRMLIDKYVLRGKPDVNRIRLLLKEED